MDGLWRQGRGYLAWALVVVALLALPVVVWLTRSDTTNDVDSINAIASPSPMASESPDADESASSSASPAGDATSLTEVPLCSNVWQSKQKLPADYDGCQSGGKIYKPTMQYCLVTYDDRFWASPGSAIHKVTGALADDGAFNDALSAFCGDDYASSASPSAEESASTAAASQSPDA